MFWQYSSHDVRHAHLLAIHAEKENRWHVVAQQYLFCLERSSAAGDARAVNFFAAKLSHAYKKMNLDSKAAYYRALCDYG